MRIMYCLPEMSHPGGIARVESIKANWLVNHGHEVYIITTDQRGSDVFYQLDKNVLHVDFGIDFTSYKGKSIIWKLFARKRMIALFEAKLKNIVDEWKPDIIVSTFNNEREFLYKWKDGSKKILEYHFCHEMNNCIIKYGNLKPIQKLTLKLKDWSMEKLAHKYDAFVVLTHEDAESWKGSKNLHVIPNMLSFTTEESSDCTSKRVIAVGRLDFQKKFDRLIDIWGEINRQCPDWHLDIFGQGPDKDNLLNRISEKGLSESVTINLPTHNIKEEYLNSSIMVMTSTYEGLPMTLLEASACGLPAICYSYKCGPRDIINNGETGYIIPEGNKNEFVSALLNLIKSDRLRIQMGLNSKKQSAHWAVDEIMEKWMQLFNEILK